MTHDVNVTISIALAPYERELLRRLVATLTKGEVPPPPPEAADGIYDKEAVISIINNAEIAKREREKRAQMGEPGEGGLFGEW